GRKGSVQAIDLTIAPGEIVGLAGLLGSGRTETARLIIGVDAPDSGAMSVEGAVVSVRSPRHAIALRSGFCPGDRTGAGVVHQLSVRENIILALQAARGWARCLSRTKQLELAERFAAALNIRTPHPEQPVGLLSGGNQQKVVLARWLASQPRLLL